MSSPRNNALFLTMGKNAIYRQKRKREAKITEARRDKWNATRVTRAVFDLSVQTNDMEINRIVANFMNMKDCQPPAGLLRRDAHAVTEDLDWRTIGRKNISLVQSPFRSCQISHWFQKHTILSLLKKTKKKQLCASRKKETAQLTTSHYIFICILFLV